MNRKLKVKCKGLQLPAGGKIADDEDDDGIPDDRDGDDSVCSEGNSTMGVSITMVTVMPPRGK